MTLPALTQPDNLQANVRGRVRKSLKPGGKTTSYFYHVNAETFNVSPTAYAALAPEHEFRVYYTPRSRRIVGMEPL